MSRPYDPGTSNNFGILEESEVLKQNEKGSNDGRKAGMLAY